ncbi:MULTISPECIES: hypothetical protein [unclassified Brevibacterium]|uniref:hypothetical protein n=1 Tax=unclassified Brevibacterium TaxID=2614124 RepID=UPI001E3E79A9|nr:MULTISPECIES: hypothetical protein [unclassified Brevibacterium]MDK8434540.1 hypothetical protein [Brevibacterium sp. H-BE7]
MRNVHAAVSRPAGKQCPSTARTCSARNNTLLQIAASMGTAVLVTIMVSATRDPEVYGVDGPVHGANIAFLVASIIGIGGIVGSFSVKNSHGLEVET